MKSRFQFTESTSTTLAKYECDMINIIEDKAL